MRKHNFFVDGGEFCFNKYGFTTQFHPQFIHHLCDIPDLFDSLNKPTMNGRWAGIRLFLEFLATETPTLYELVKHSESPLGCLQDKQLWTVTLLSYRDWVKEKRVTNERANKSLRALNWWIKNLHDEKVIPELDRVANYPVSKVKKRKKPSTILDTVLPDHVLESIGADPEISMDEIQRIYSHTRYEVALLEDKPDGFDNLPAHEQSQWVLETRLHTIRVGVEQQFLDAKRIRLEGLRAIKAHKHLVPLISNFLSWKKSPQTGRYNPYVEEVHALGLETYRNALLSWFWYENNHLQLKDKDGGIYGTARTNLGIIRTKEGLPSKEFGWNDRWFGDRLGCTESLIAPSALLLVFDHAMNATPAYDIGNEPISDEFGVPVVNWVKKRAQSALFKFLPDDITVSADDVVRVVNNATRTYRKLLLEEYDIEDNFLFLNYFSSKEPKTGLMIPRKPEWNTFTTYTKAALSRVSEAEWTATSEQLRNSILLLKALVGGVDEVKEEAQHDGEDKRISTKYADKALPQMQHHHEMREFKEWLQTIITLNIEDAASKLGVDPSEYRRRADEYLKSRFGGLACGNPKAGTQKGTQKGQTCNKIARCLFCPNRRNVFIESVENIIHLLQWEEALNIGAKNGEIDPNSPHWFFWFAFIREMLLRLTEDDMAGAKKKAMLEEARNEANSRLNPYLNIDFKKVI